jgi:hypothetical protein
MSFEEIGTEKATLFLRVSWNYIDLNTVKLYNVVESTERFWYRMWTLWRSATLAVLLKYTMSILQCSCVCVCVCVRARARAILIWVHVFPISLLATFSCVRKNNAFITISRAILHIFTSSTRMSILRHFFTTRNYLTDFESGRETKSRRESEFT